MAIVLLCADPSDPHTISVGAALSRRGLHSETTGLWDSWSGCYCVEIGGASPPGIRSALSDQEVHSLWWRVKPPASRYHSEGSSFVVRERREHLMALASALPSGTLFVNQPWAQEQARNKCFQLLRAVEGGLTIPRTWFCSTPLTFCDSEAGDLIYKAQTWLATDDGRFLFTTRVSSETLAANREAIEVAPGIYQRFIQKKCEYRITFVGEECFSVRLRSQDVPAASLDWRRDTASVPHEVCRLDTALEHCLRTLVRRLGLSYAAIDLIEDTNGIVYFLEANPAGNWLWLEAKTGLRISDAIASLLDFRRGAA